MKKIILTISLAFFASGLFAGNVQTISINNSQTEFKVTKNESTRFTFKTSFSSIQAKEVYTKNGSFNQLYMDGYIDDGEIGTPGLPTLKKLIEMPFGANAQVNILSYDEEIISLNDLGITAKIKPLQPSVRKDQDPDRLPFHYNSQAYSMDDFTDRPIAEVQSVGIMRGVRMGRLVLRPIQYNPVQNTIRIIKNIVAEVVFENADLATTQNMKTKYYSPMFDLTQNFIVNYKEQEGKDLITTYPVKYVIVSDRMFEATLQPFIQWKTRKGFKVVTAYTDVIGTTTTAIKNYLQGLYTAATPSDPAPTYVLLVGDVAQIPAFTGTTASHPTDLYYCEYTGDIIPECYYGRFSATNNDELTPQINKTLEYEQYLMPDPSFLNEVVMIAGQDATYGPLHGDGQINYGTSTYFNLAHNLTSHTYLFNISASSSPAIISNVSTGCSYANYTAHGGQTGWSNPAFSVSDIPTLANAHKYPLMVGNCCLTNTFNYSVPCFGEALLRANNKGAIGYIGGSNNTYWDEDFWWGVGFKTVTVNPVYSAANLGAYDKLFHDHSETESDWYVSQGQMVSAGNLAVTQSSSSRINYYWEIYHLMGDPSLMPYLGVPPVLSPVNYLSSIPIGPTTITVTTEPYAYVGLSLNSVWVDAKYTGSTGIVNLDITSITGPCTLDIVITKQNRQPHIGTITIVPNSTPYIVYESNVIHDAGVAVNGNVEYSETGILDVTLQNVGTQDATNITATISTTNTDVTITDNTQPYGTINANTSSTQNSAFAFTVANVIADQQTVPFTVTASDGGAGTWNTTFNVLLNAPVMQATTVVVDDASQGNGNGRLDPGESVTIKILTSNTGHAISPAASGTLNLNSGAVTISSNTQNLGQITTTAPVLASFNVIVDAGAQIGSTASFTYDVNASGYTATKSFVLTIGLIVEDYETNTFTHFPWDMTDIGDAPWTIINSGSIYEGDYTARSGVIGNGTYSVPKTSKLTMDITVLSADSLSFYKKVNSELDYDFLTFFVDGVQQGQWSGVLDWSRAVYYITAGPHTLQWVYSKDYSTAPTGDGAWVDFIIFPPIDEAPLAITETNNGLQYLTLYPNPAKSEAVLSYSLIQKSNIRIDLMNAMGQTMSTMVLDNESEGAHILPLNTSEMASGIYFCKFSINEKIQIIKFIVSK